MDEEGDNANTLHFGPGFDFEGKEKLQCLSNAEVAIVLEQQKGNYEEKDINVTPAFAKTLQYVKRYGAAGDRDVNVATTKELRRALEAFEQYTEEGPTQLHQFEISALANLMQADSTAEEAMALIPSLGKKFNEDEVESILELVKSHASRRMYG